MTDLDTYLSAAEKALMDLLKKWRPRLLESHGVANYDLKADYSVVTDFDKGLELAIKDVLRPLSNDVGFVGEEHGQEGPEETFWFVDPIDGTEQFIRGLDACRTLLTLIQDGEPVYAFAYRFTTDDLFTAQKGKGAFKNGQILHASIRELGRCWVEVATDLKIPASVAAIVAISAVINSVVYTKEFLNVIDGSVDAYVVMGGKGKMWDYAPRALMMREAGYKVTNIGSDTYNYKDLSLLAASHEVYDTLANLLSPQA